MYSKYFYMQYVLLLQVAYEDHDEFDLLEQCKRVRCKAGRECRVLSSGAAECVCRDRCPAHDHPVCGSDGVLYENHCELHRQACLAATHIRPEVMSSSPFDNTTPTQCANNPWAKFKRKLQREVQEMRQREDMKIKVPSEFISTAFHFLHNCVSSFEYHA